MEAILMVGVILLGVGFGIKIIFWMMRSIFGLIFGSKRSSPTTEELFDRMSRQAYELNNEIEYINNKTLSQEEKKEKGDRYEMACAQYFKDLGYSVIERGLELGKKDGGVDLVAFDEHEMIMIQCKDWNGTHQITSKELRTFFGDCFGVLEEYEDIDERTIKRLFITSKDILDYSAKSYLHNHPDRVQHLILEWQ